jgi:hypothetical protein
MLPIINPAAISLNSNGAPVYADVSLGVSVESARSSAFKPTNNGCPNDGCSGSNSGCANAGC